MRVYLYYILLATYIAVAMRTRASAHTYVRADERLFREKPHY